MNEDKRVELTDRIRDILLSELTPEQAALIEHQIIVTVSDYDVTSRETELSISESRFERTLKVFLATKKLEGRAQSTITRYNYELNRMYCAVNKPIEEIGVYDLRTYLAKLDIDGKKPGTLNSLRGIISSFFSWAYEEKFLDSNPARNLNPIKCRVECEDPFSDTDIDIIRSACNNEKKRALIELLLSTGVRVEECANLDISDINFITREVHVRHGKGDKERYTFMSSVAAMWLKRYLNGRTEGPIFINNRRERITAHGIWTILKCIGDRAGIESVHPHRFRHTFATMLSNKGVDILDIARLLGHSSVNTTSRYAHENRDKLRSSYSRVIA